MWSLGQTKRLYRNYTNCLCLKSWSIIPSLIDLSRYRSTVRLTAIVGSFSYRASDQFKYHRWYIDAALHGMTHLTLHGRLQMLPEGHHNWLIFNDIETTTGDYKR
jgi:hypothetical protein